MGFGRRTFVSGLAAAAALGGGVLRSAPASAPMLTSETLSSRTRLIRGAGGNIVATLTDAGLVVVDGGLVEHRDAVLRLLQAQFGTRDIAWLIDTHWHREQTGLNEFVGSKGGVVCAHENTKLWLATEFYVDWQDRTYGPLPRAALPGRTFYAGDERATVGGREVHFGKLPNAHTDGDVFVRFPDEDLLVVGGALTPGAWPLMDYSTGGWLGGLVEASRRIAELAGARTRIVAASGGVVGRDVAASQAKLATTMQERISSAMKQGKSAQDMLDERITQEFDAERGDPAFFVRSGYKGLWGHIRELGIS